MEKRPVQEIDEDLCILRTMIAASKIPVAYEAWFWSRRGKVKSINLLETKRNQVLFAADASIYIHSALSLFLPLFLSQHSSLPTSPQLFARSKSCPSTSESRVSEPHIGILSRNL